jgi:DNA-binding response OmpR family regulator
LVILDLKMPGENGLDFIAPLRELERNVPILILTAHASLESALLSVRKGATDYFLKPIEPAFLENRLSEIFKELDKERHEQRVLNQIGVLLGELGEESDSTGASGRKIGVAKVENLLICGPVAADIQTKIIRLHNEIVHLSPTATRYLIALMKAYPETVLVVDLVREAQGYQVNLSEARDLARWRIHEIRKIFQDMRDRPEIQTVRGMGYRLVV